MAMTAGAPGDQILIQDSKGRVRTPKARREALLEEYERSGMSGVAFAEHVGINYSTLAAWIQRKRKQARGEPKAAEHDKTVQWMEAVVAPIPPHRREPGGARGLQIRLGGGALMEVVDKSGALLAAEVLRHLGETR